MSKENVKAVDDFIYGIMLEGTAKALNSDHRQWAFCTSARILFYNNKTEFLTLYPREGWWYAHYITFIGQRLRAMKKQGLLKNERSGIYSICTPHEIAKMRV